MHLLVESKFLNLSFVGSYALREALSEDTSNVIITQVVPSLESTESPVVGEYLAALKKFDPNVQANFVSLEGYIVAKIFHRALLNIEQEITKESIIDGIEAMKGVDIGLDQQVYYDVTDHQAINKLWLTCLRNGEFEEFQWQQLLDKKTLK